MTGQLLALNNNWLNDSGTAGGYVPTQTSGVDALGNCIPFYPSTGYWGWWSYPVYVSSPSRPIKLTLSEIERLRKVARTDKQLKDILAKFTDQIEITVDFN